MSIAFAIFIWASFGFWIPISNLSIDPNLFRDRDADREMDNFPRNRQFSAKFGEIFAIFSHIYKLSKYFVFWAYFPLLFIQISQYLS